MMSSPDYKNSIFKNDEIPLDDQALGIYVINIFITTISRAGRGKQISNKNN